MKRKPESVLPGYLLAGPYSSICTKPDCPLNTESFVGCPALFSPEGDPRSHSCASCTCPGDQRPWRGQSESVHMGLEPGKDQGQESGHLRLPGSRLALVSPFLVSKLQFLPLSYSNPVPKPWSFSSAPCPNLPRPWNSGAQSGVSVSKT